MQAVHQQTGLRYSEVQCKCNHLDWHAYLSSVHVHTTWLMTMFYLASELMFALSQFMLVKGKHKW